MDHATGRTAATPGLRIALGRRGVAFHIGDGVYVTAAHCVTPWTEGDVVRSFGLDLRLTRVMSGDVALMTTVDTPDGGFTLAHHDDGAITIGTMLCCLCWRSRPAVGAIRVVSVSRDAATAEPATFVRPLPGDSGAPVFLPSSNRVVGLIRGAAGPGVLQNQILIQRFDAQSLKQLHEPRRPRNVSAAPGAVKSTV